MEYNINWQSIKNQKSKEVVEALIKKDLENLPTFLPCHEGPALITLSYSDPLSESIVGNIKCKCGVPIGLINGVSDGSKMKFSPITK